MITSQIKWVYKCSHLTPRNKTKTNKSITKGSEVKYCETMTRNTRSMLALYKTKLTTHYLYNNTLL